MRHVRVHQRGHVVEMLLDGKRIFAQQQRLHRFNPRTRHRSRCSRLSVARQAGVGVDANKAIARGSLDAHGFNACDLDLVPVRRCQCAVLRQPWTRR